MLRRYVFDDIGAINEDELPDDMTEADYRAWFAESWVDIVRLGPRPLKCEEWIGPSA